MYQNCRICGRREELSQEEQELYDRVVATGKLPSLTDAGDIDAVCPDCSPLTLLSEALDECSTASFHETVVTRQN